jgi:dihydroxyacid dehydratase/phosphogluconate dehydratase
MFPTCLVLISLVADGFGGGPDEIRFADIGGGDSGIGACIGHVSPEAAARGPIAALNEGDLIQIDLVARSLNVKLSDAEIQSRLDALPPFESKTTSKWLKRYSHFVTSADTGAVLES